MADRETNRQSDAFYCKRENESDEEEEKPQGSMPKFVKLDQSDPTASTSAASELISNIKDEKEDTLSSETENLFNRKMTKVTILLNEIQKEEVTDNENNISISKLLSKCYTEDLGKVDIYFDKPLYRALYIYKYYEWHSQFTRMSLRLIKDKHKRHEENRLQNSFDSFTFLEYLKKRQRENRLVVTSIGGGPGADLEGFYRFWSEDVKQGNEDEKEGNEDEKEGNANLTLKNIDCYEGWRECYESFMTLLNLMPDNYEFERINIFTPDQSAAIQMQLENSDLVIMCRFLSAVYYYSLEYAISIDQNRMNEPLRHCEVATDLDTIQMNEAIRELLRNMKSGAYFLLVDNMYRAWNNECLKRMKNILEDDDEFTLLLDYGNSRNYHITLDDDLKQEMTDQNLKYARVLFNRWRRFSGENDRTGVGFQLWKRTETATSSISEGK